MIKLIRDMERLQAEESKRANAIHGDTFKSFAEGWLALEEEIDEASVELEDVNSCRENVLRGIRKARSVETQKGGLELLRYNAILAACELVQVAHVAHKMINSPDVWAEDTH